MRETESLVIPHLCNDREAFHPNAAVRIYVFQPIFPLSKRSGSKDDDADKNPGIDRWHSTDCEDSEKDKKGIGNRKREIIGEEDFFSFPAIPN